MRVYIASPYSLGDPVRNVRNSLLAADRLVVLGHTPFVPLLSHFWHFFSPKDYETWMRMDLEWVAVCDALIRLEGESAGADREMQEALDHDIPVFYSLTEFETRSKT